ncbi:MAG: class I SAM-dependent methyltransferase [Candidatus Omnitrophica bacterium]|nr:class I SAM-dependent methyltransferase [Candidatus Omnitrophota bacterium]
MPKTFVQYSKVYDILYKDKDYDSECAFLRRIFKKYSRRPVNDVLDVACGTGNHILPLAKCGFSISAQDISCYMLKIAKYKAGKAKLNIKFSSGSRPMQDFRHDKKFDAVIAMFASVGYVTNHQDLKRAFVNIRNCLREGGVFTFDFWNKDAVKKYFLPHKEKVFIDGDSKVCRVSDTVLDNRNSLAKIKYLCTYFEGGKKKKAINELHRMKYYTQGELSQILEDSGFKVLDSFPFMRIGKIITGKDWNISIVATPKN